MTTVDRKQMRHEYKITPRPIGIYRVRNAPMRKSLIGSSVDLPSMLNRLRFQLEGGLHMNKALQKDWNELGPSSFTFEVLDLLQPRDEPTYNPSDDLSVLTEIWVEKLVASGELLY